MPVNDLFPPSFLRQLEALRAALLRLRGSAGEGLRGGRTAGRHDFRGHRPYAVGDDLRRVDWNAYGRLGRFYLREFEAEKSEHLTVLVDRSRSMSVGNPGKYLLARRVAAAFGYLALDGGGTATVAGNAAVEGPSRFPKLLETLRAEADFRKGGIGDSLQALAAGPRTPRNLLVITDGLEPLEWLQPLTALSAKRCEITLLLVLSPDELDPAGGGTAILRDSETGAELPLDLDASTVGAYRTALAGHLDAIGQLALRHGWVFAVSASDADLRGLMVEKLIPAGAAP